MSGIWTGFPLKKFDALFLPGGFSYGDYIRPGAMAALSPLMGEVKAFAREGKPVLGICNGFQILLELGLLPGALLPNSSLRFVCKPVFLRVENSQTPFTCEYQEGEVVQMGVAHGDGNYYINEEGLRELEKEKRIIFRYSNEFGDIKENVNPNGSLNNIGGIINGEGNV